MSGGKDGRQALSERGVRSCRACGADDLASVLDLRSQPLANKLLESPEADDPRFPLHLRICTSCGLGQLGEFVLPERIFSDYPYLSSVSSSWVAHARNYAARLTEELLLDDSSLVMEVASNDGYLLREFQELGVPVLGIEPAENVASLARSLGVPTTSAFFGSAAAAELVAKHGHPRLVAANNVMAHVPDLQDFLAGIAMLCDSSTVVTVENPSFLGLLLQTQFDTIYHEHFSYLSVHALRNLVVRHSLELFRVEELPTHGGSYRYWISQRSTRHPEPSVAAAVENEVSGGLLAQPTWEAFAQRSQGTVAGLRSWLEERRSSGCRVAGYGAAAKGNTLLNAASVGAGELLAVADGSPEKQGRYLPGSRIPVVSPQELAGLSPDDVLLLPWNLTDELAPIVVELCDGAHCWTAVPEMRRCDP